jgi:hypothetical protein
VGGQQAGSLSDIQRALLQGSGVGGAAPVPALPIAKPAQGQEGGNYAISEALRNLLQKNQGT